MRLTSTLAVSIGLALGCACSHDEPPPTTPSTGSALPAPIDVCVHVDGASPQPGRAVPSRAGVYEPNAPVDPTLLNWTVEGFGCVAYPGADTPRVSCTEGSARPRVTTVLCQQ